jgi:uncharacterized damage-inducible protein DinB
MIESQLLTNQIKTTYKGDSWHGPNLMKTLESIDYKQAQKKPLEERHSIWELVDHMAVWINTPIQVLQSGEYPEVPEDVNWKPMGDSEEEWQNSINNLEKAVNSLIDALRDVPDEKFDETINGQEHNYRSMLYGVLHHNLYHMGQISILKKKL